MKIDKAKIRFPQSNQSKPQAKTTRASIFTEDVREEILNIPVHKLFPYSKQARQTFDNAALEKLAQTIKTHGIRQPLTVIDVHEDREKFEVVSGERRFRAAKLAGLERIPCRVLKNARDAVEISIIENLQREDLHPIEVARSLKVLLDEGICKEQKEIALKVGMSKSVVSELLTYLNMSNSIQTEVINNKITSRDKLRTIRDASDDVIRRQLINPRPYSSGGKKGDAEKIPSRERKVISISLDGSKLKFSIKHSLLSEEQKQEVLEKLQKILLP